MKNYDYVIEEANAKKWTSVKGIVNLATRNHEHNIIAWIRENVHNRDLFLDIGANVGCISINLSDHFKKIIALEPNEINLFMLRNNIKINSIGNMDVIGKAAWSENKKLYLQIFSNNDQSGKNTTVEKQNPNCLRNVEVDAITVDSLNIDPSFVKIDIEGSEMECLKGMTETMKRCKPVLLVEIHKCYGVNYNCIIKYLKQFGYKEKMIHQNPEVYYYIFD